MNHRPMTRLSRGFRISLSIALLCTTAMPAIAAAEDAPAASDSQDILVTARADKKSRALQREAPNIMQSISQEEAFRLPDVNAGEVIARLPGVTIGSDKGIGHFVNIRGLDADLTSTSFGGTHLPPPDPVTPQNGGRAFSFDALPIGLFGTMSITKTNRPDMDAEALGGTIEITPKAIPANRNYFVQLRAGSGEQLSRHTPILDLSGSAGLRFGGTEGNRPFSIILAGSWYRDALGMDDRRTSYVNKSGVADLAWSSMSQSNNKFIHRTRGVSAELAYERDENSRWYVRYLNSGYEEDNWRQQINFRTNGAATINADGSLTSGLKQVDKSLRDTLLYVNLQLAEVGGRNQIGTVKIDYKASYAQGREYRPYDTISTFSAKPSNATITYRDAGGNFPAYTTAGYDPFGTAGYALASVTNNTNLYRTREWSGAVNALLPVAITGGTNETIKFGAAVRLRTNTHAYDPLTTTGVPAIGLADAAGGPNVITDQNHYSNGPDISIDYTRDRFARGTGAGFTTSATANAYAAALVQQDNRENVFAGFVQGESDFGALHLIAGLRMEHTDAEYRGNIATGKAFSPIASQSRYTNFFPSLQARYNIAATTILRGAFSSTIARPGFNQIDPAATIDSVNNTVTTGNPNLKPIMAKNFDLSFEQYLPFGGIASVGLFDKELSNYIFSRTQTGGITDPTVQAALAGAAGTTIVTTYANIARAWVRGVEFNYDQRLTFLPGPLTHLGIAGNYTFVDSSADIRPGEKGPLPATSKHIYNVTTYWDDGKLNLRAALSFAGRSLWSVGAKRALDQYAEARLNLDIGATYSITDNLAIYASARNLLNTPKIRSEGSIDHTVQHQIVGSAVLGGVNVKF